MNLAEHILYNLNYEELDHYVCRTDGFKKAMIDYDEGFAKIVKRILPNLSESEAIRLREEFMSIYDRRIPGYEDTLKKIGEIEKNLVRSQNRVLLAKKNLKRSKKINENKLVRVRKLNDEAKKNVA